MKVKILQNLPRTIDGQKIGPFTQGQEINLDDAIAAKFIGSAFAEKYVEPVVDAPVQKPAKPVEASTGADAAEKSEAEGRTRRANRKAE